MDLLDRAFQLKVLRSAAAKYPEPLYLVHRSELNEDVRLPVNLAYLAGHDLLQVDWKRGPKTGFPLSATATVRGLDFLQDDGGLSAILGVVTVRLDDETIKALLIRKVEAAEGDPTVKARLVETIRSLPADATKAVTMRALEEGLQSLPAGVLALRTLFGL